MREKITVRMFQASIESGRTKHIRLRLDEKELLIPVDEAVYAYFSEQFLRKNPTALQQKRFATIMNVLRVAYLKGVEDGKAQCQ